MEYQDSIGSGVAMTRKAFGRRRVGHSLRRMTCTLALMFATPAFAQTALKPPLQPLSFLVGEWKGDDGKVAETGGTSKGGSRISVEADGWALLRQDHTELFDKAGKPAGAFHQTMMIYPDNGMVHADYVDGEGHAIHYVSADVATGKSVTFTSAKGAGPVFRLSYVLESPGRLKVNFGMIPPGQDQFRPIATGSLNKVQ
jgi:hypothetical protein